MHGLERVAREPVPGRLSFKMLQKQLNLSSADLLREGHEYAGMSQVAVVLQDFVLENKMISERVPSQV